MAPHIAQVEGRLDSTCRDGPFPLELFHKEYGAIHNITLNRTEKQPSKTDNA